jgi:Cu+-exporting ATPase
VAIDDIAVGDLLHVPTHATVPVDGEVVDGTADVNESLMTGEPLPVTRKRGDKVLGGSIVSGGILLIRATAVGHDSAYGRIVQLVAQAQSGRTQMQRIADRVAAIFTPIVIAAAVATLAAWLLVDGRAALADAMRAAIAVLVVACPCALGLATPTVVLVASGRAALRGILVRDAASLEAMGRVDTVVWDKTGTLTSGIPSIRWIWLPGGVDEPTLISLAASAEQFSTHPIAKAIEARARREGLELTVPAAFESVPGGGVASHVGQRDVLVGSVSFLDSRGVSDIQVRGKNGAAEDPRDTIVAVAVDGQLVGVIALADTIRPSAADAVARLRRLGLASELLTGDSQGVARAVADEVDIKDVSAACSPADKFARIAQLRRDDRKVAMVGDGVNDAAALAAADVGIAFAIGADVASEAAGINLIGSSPHLVADAVALARASLRIMRQNLFWAFFYNVLMIPLAALGKLPPGLAAGAMMFSSLTVVLNALRLPRVVDWEHGSRFEARGASAL